MRTGGCYNCELNEKADGLRGEFRKTNIKVLGSTLDEADIWLDSIHIYQSGIEKMVFAIRSFVSSVYKPAGCNFLVKKIVEF